MSQTDNEKRVSNGPHSSPIDRAALKRLCAEANGLVEEAIREIAELPDRTSPASWPEAMLVTSDELSVVLGPLKRLSRAVANVPALLSELEAVERRYKAALNRLADCSRDLTAKDAEIERLEAEIYELGRCGSPIDPNGQAILIISAFVSSFQSINDGPFELSKSSQGWDFSRLRDARDRAKQLLKTLNGDARHGAR